MNSTNTSNGSSCPSFSEDTPGEKVGKTLAYAVVIFLSLAGNIMVIGVVFKKQKMRTITNHQIVNLAIADILITVAAMPATVFQIYERNRWPFGLVLCKLVVFLQGISVSCSVFTMVCIAVDRFCAIVFPYKKYINQRRSNLMIAFVWFISVALQSPTLYAMKLHRTSGGERTCVEDWTPLFDNLTLAKIYTVVLFVSMYLFPLIVIAVLYTGISWFLWSHKTPGSQLGTSRKDRSKANVIKMLVIIVVVFAVCWLPIFVTQFVTFFAAPKCGVSPYLSFVGFFFSHANSAINPCIYVVFNHSFRRGFVELLILWFVPKSLISPKRRVEETMEISRRDRRTTGTVEPLVAQEQKLI